METFLPEVKINNHREGKNIPVEKKIGAPGCLIASDWR